MEYLASLSKYDIVSAVLQSLLVILSMGTAFGYLTKRSGNRSSNVFFSLLVSVFAFSIITLVLEHLAITVRYPSLQYVPLWFTWTIGPAWFFYVKFSVFPAYQWRWTDAKHFVFPLIQFLYYTVVFFGDYHSALPDHVLGLQTTTWDEVIFIISVGGYFMASYRYLRYKRKTLTEQKYRWDFWKIKLLLRSQRILLVLLMFNFIFVVFNFTTEQQSGYDLLHLRSFYATSSLTFGLILLYLLRGVAYRQHFYPQVPPQLVANLAEDASGRLRKLTIDQEGFCDPDLHEVRVARAIDVEPESLDKLALGFGFKTWWKWIEYLRLQELVKRKKKRSIPLRQAALEVGFASRRVALQAIKKQKRNLES